MARKLLAFAERPSASGVLEIDCYDVVGESWSGDGFSAKGLLGKLRESTPAEIHIRVNSMGGDAFDGVAIYNLLRDQSARGVPVNIDVDGIAASAASIIAAAGDTVRIASNALVMIHEAWMVTQGPAEDHDASAAMLRKLNQQMADTYAECATRHGKKTTRDDALAAMKAETWLDAAEAVEFGIGTETSEPTKAAAMAVSLAAIEHPLAIPAASRASVDPNAEAEMLTAEHERQLSERSSKLPVESRADSALGAAAPTTNPVAPPPQPTESNPMLNKILAALGAKDEAEALAIADKVPGLITGAQAAIETADSLCKATGKPLSEALAVVEAWRSGAERVPALQAKIAEHDAAEKARGEAAAKAECESLIDGALESGKLTVAQKAWAATQTADQLRAYLEVATVAIPGAGKPPIGEPALAGAASLTAEERQVAANLHIALDEFAKAKAERLSATPITDDE